MTNQPKEAAGQQRYIAKEIIIEGKCTGHYLFDTEKGYEVGEIYTKHSPELLPVALNALNNRPAESELAGS